LPDPKVSLLSLLLLASCATSPLVPSAVVGCRLVRPPPVRPAIQVNRCPSGPYDACLSTGDALRLANYVESLSDWSDDAWGRCHGVQDAK
jgi:hypothetical protein